MSHSHYFLVALWASCCTSVFVFYFSIPAEGYTNLISYEKHKSENCLHIKFLLRTCILLLPFTFLWPNPVNHIIELEKGISSQRKDIYSTYRETMFSASHTAREKNAKSCYRNTGDGWLSTMV